MSSLLDQDDSGNGTPPPVSWLNAASPVGGDVVLSGAVLLFLVLAFAFVLYHYITVTCQGERNGDGAGTSSSGRRARTRRGTVGDDAVTGTAGGRGGVNPVVLRALPLTVYSAKDRGGEALECAVCLDVLADGEAARFLPRCGHGFHAECVDLWLRGHATCPLCRVWVGIDKTHALPLPLPPALPEPANYPRNLPTNVLFWGSHDTVTTSAVGGASSSVVGAPGALVIHVRDRETAAAKPLGLARLSSLRRLWNRGRHQDTAASSSRSCRRNGDGTEQAPQPLPLEIRNIT